MIQFSDAYLNFGSTVALQGCDLKIEQGEKVALIGPSGSGKSSLLKTIASEYILNSGILEFEGTNTAELSGWSLKTLRRKIAYIPQDLALVPNIKVSQNVILGKVGSQWTLSTVCQQLFIPPKKLKQIFSILQEVGIPEKIFHRTDSLSGGQQQRVAIARALYQAPSIILADEPVSAVDPTRAHSLLECLTDLTEKKSVTLLCSLHNLEYAKRFFPRIIGMRNGEIAFDGKAEDFSIEEFNSLYQLDHA